MNTLNEGIVAAISKQMANNKKILPFLMELLDLGRESVYRRLRGEIPFTFEEVSKISLSLGISTDEIIGMQQADTRALFNIHELGSPNPMDAYSDNLEDTIAIFKRMKEDKNSKLIMAINHLPIILSVQFENLTKFRHYKWAHQTQQVPLNFYFSDFALSSQRFKQYKTYIYNYVRVGDITAIVDSNMILSVTKEVSFFYKRNLITKEEFDLLQDELLQVIDYMEVLAQTGINEPGANISIYLSYLNIESNSRYMEFEDTKCVQFWVYKNNPITVFNEKVCQIQKEWLESLKKYSTLISRSNEIQQSQFFNKQREYIRNIENH